MSSPTTQTPSAYYAYALQAAQDALSASPRRRWHPECLTAAILATAGLTVLRTDATHRPLPPCPTCLEANPHPDQHRR